MNLDVLRAALERIRILRGKLRAYIALGRAGLREATFDLLWRYAEMLGLDPFRVVDVTGNRWGRGA
jgi:hypothetical protein